MKKNLIIIICLLYYINSIDISILKGEKLFNNNTPIILNIISNDVKEKKSNVELICVIDISGSMRGEKIKLVKQSLKILIEMMGEKDKLGLVLFNQQAYKLLDLTYVTDKKNIISLIDSINVGGGTYILSGLEMAVNMFKENKREEKNFFDKFITSSAMILLSDGNDNIMNHIEIGNGLKNLTKDMKLFFTLHAFGYGEDHDPNIMNTLANIRDGAFYFVQDYKKVIEYFVNVLGACMSMISENAKIIIKSKYDIKKVFGVEDLYSYVLKDNKNFETELLQLIGGKEYTFVLEVDVPDDNDNNFIEVEFNYDEGGKINKIINKKFDDMNEHNIEKANEEYIRSVTFDTLNEAMKLREELKGNDAKEKLNEMKKWLNGNYKGKQNYIEDIEESLNLINDDLLYESKGRAFLLSSINEGQMKRGGSKMSFQNTLQRDMINSINY
jgi:uncharacterized protein YegL